MNRLSFGTSGLRGDVADLVGWPSYAYTLAFLRFLDEQEPPGLRRIVYIGRDLRPSSLDILGNWLWAAIEAGYEPVDCGALPAPALALMGFKEGCPAIMITGSHIPDNQNRLKFYRRQSEITKSDEEGIRHQLMALTDGGTPIPQLRNAVPSSARSLFIERYRRRYLDFFPADCLSGLHVGVFSHSSVARDVLVDVIAELGASVHELGRSDFFHPVDTETHRPEDLARIQEWARTGAYDAIVSADGDADRPLVADEHGLIIPGDLLGLITARYFDLRTIVTPVTSSMVIEMSGIPETVVRTKVGSYAVIQGMQQAFERGSRGIAGFEANGGFFLQGDLHWGRRVLKALPTRDALLPILACLAEAEARGMPLSLLRAQLQSGWTASRRLPNVPAAQSARFLHSLATDAYFLGEFFAPIGTLTSISVIDGFKATLVNGCTVHFRSAGNAAELLCYVEAGSQVDAERLLHWSLGRARDQIAGML